MQVILSMIRNKIPNIILKTEFIKSLDTWNQKGIGFDVVKQT